MRDNNHLYDALMEKSKYWDFLGNNEAKNNAFDIILYASKDYLENIHPDFDYEMAILREALEKKSMSVKAALDSLSKHTYFILKSRPYWDDEIYLNRGEYTEETLREKLMPVVLRGAKRSNVRQNRRWDRYLKIPRFRWRQRSGRPLVFTPSLLMFCNSVCIAYLHSGKQLPKSVYEAGMHKHADLLNLLSDCLDVIEPQLEIDETSLLKSWVKNIRN